MKSVFLITLGIIIGVWIAWPGILIPKNWKCFRNIINKSVNDKISLKAVLAVSPSYILNGKSINNSSKIRLVGDACFR
tara:strand:- start:368 stop:601 length:234 start_codon:yes stop_codon:yes gene_type:complete